MMLALGIVVAVTVTYAVNTWKIRLVARGRATTAATMEATQAFLYMYVLLKILKDANTALGIAAYVAGAFLGTIGAMALSRRTLETSAPHHHDCCPLPDLSGSTNAPGTNLIAFPRSRIRSDRHLTVVETTQIPRSRQELEQ